MLKQGFASGLSLSARSAVPYICWSCEIRQLAAIRIRRTTLPHNPRSLSTYPALRNGESPNEPTDKADSGASNDAAPVTNSTEERSSSHVREVLTDVPAGASQSSGKSKRKAKRRKTSPKAAGSIATAKAAPRRVKVKSKGRNKRQSKKAQQLRELIRKIQTPRQISELHELKEEGIPLGELPSNISMKDAMSRAPKGTRTSMIKTGDVEFSAIDAARGPVPELAYGLSRVLFNQGITELRDVRTRVFNFDSYLDKLIPVKDFDFNTLGTFKTPSNDPVLAEVAAKSGKRFIGSTSSMTGMLKHFHYLISAWREPNLTKVMSREFPLGKKLSYTKVQKAPDAVFLRWKNGVYAIDADKEHDSPNILSMLGKYMEKLLTVPKATFEKHRVGQSHKLTKEEREVEDSYHYSTVDDFVIRSQLDAHDSRLPGTGMFDLKTRAVLPIRMSVRDHEWGMDYELKQRHGEFESYEREYHDMVRATMLKYSLQVRLGRMDGIFVAYHNIARIFGFQYIGLDELDLALHGQKDQIIGDQELAFSLRMLNEVFDKATKKFPEQSLRVHVETRPATTPFMYVFVEPVTEEQVTKVQNSKKALVEAYERKVLGLDAKEISVEEKAATSKKSSSEMTNTSSKRHKAKYEATKHFPLSHVEEQKVENAGIHDASVSEKSAPPTEHDNSASNADKVHEVVREAAKEASTNDNASTHDASVPEASLPSTEIDQSANVTDEVDEVVQKAVKEASTDASASDKSVQDDVVEKLSDSIESGDTQFLEKVAKKVAKVKVEHGPLLGFVVRARSFVDGQHVPRPEDLTKDQTWTLQYTIAEIDNPERARSLYDAVITRRKGLLGRTEEDDVRESDYFIDKLKAITAQSKKWREELDAADAGRPKIDLDAIPAEMGESEIHQDLQEHEERRNQITDFHNMIKTVQDGYDGLSNIFKGLFASAGVKDRSEQPLGFGRNATPPETSRHETAAFAPSRSIQLDQERHILDNIADRNFSTRNITTKSERSRSPPVPPVPTSAEIARDEKVKTMTDAAAKVDKICEEHYYRTLPGRLKTSVPIPEYEIKVLLRSLIEYPDHIISKSAKCSPGTDEAGFHAEWLRQVNKLQVDLNALRRSFAGGYVTTKVARAKARELYTRFNKPFLGGKVPEPPTARTEGTFNVQDYSGVVTPSSFEPPKQPANLASGGIVGIDAQHDPREAANATDMPKERSTGQDGVPVTKEELDQTALSTSVDSTSFPQPDVVELEEADSNDMAVGTQTSLSNSDRNDAVFDEEESPPAVDPRVDPSRSKDAESAEGADEVLAAQVKNTSSVDEVTISVPSEEERR